MLALFIMRDLFGLAQMILFSLNFDGTKLYNLISESKNIVLGVLGDFLQLIAFAWLFWAQYRSQLAQIKA
jgi:hypothetical protein